MHETLLPPMENHFLDRGIVWTMFIVVFHTFSLGPPKILFCGDGEHLELSRCILEMRHHLGENRQFSLAAIVCIVGYERLHCHTRLIQSGFRVTEFR